ncbi:MAG: TonB-dependent receptor [Pseudomonadota bacterium]
MKSQLNTVARAAAWLYVLLIFLTTLEPAALAKEPAEEAANASRRLEIAAGPLSRALKEIATTYGTSVFAPDELVAGETAPRISGRNSLPEALATALATTNLTFQTAAEGSYVITEKPPGEENVRIRSENAPRTVEEEIIVLGTKRNLSLQDTQTSVSVVTMADIEEQALFTVEDILLRTPNVSTNGDGSLNGLSIRGISISGVGGAGRGQTANVYVDGSPNSEAANLGAANLWDVEQVQILRGPQSTIQGRNALAGALVTTTADPDYEFGADLRIVAGNENNRQYSGTLNVPLINDKLAVRFALDQREIDFEVLNVASGNTTRFQEAFTGRAKLLWEPTDDLRLEVGHSYTDTEIGDRNRMQAPGPVGSPEFEAFDPFGRETYRERFTNIEVNRTYLEARWDLNQAWSLFGLVTREDGLNDVEFGLGSSLSDNTTYTAELRAAFDFGRLKGWFGAYWFDIESPNSTTFSGPFPFPSIPADASIVARTSGTSTTENRALFADVTYDLNERWTFSVGLRYDDEEFRNLGGETILEATPADCVVAPFVPTFGGQPCDALIGSGDGNAEPLPRGSFDAWLPRASIIHRFALQRSLSFNYARGYRAGGSYIRIVPPAPVLSQFDPEYLDNYELAWRSEWFERRLVFNANVFYSDWQDQQIAIPGPTGFDLDTLIVNAGASELYGVEIETRFRFTDTLTGFATLGLVNSEFKDFPFAVDENGDPVNAEDPTYANLAGNEFNTAPRTTFTVGLAWDQGAGWFASGNVSYASSQFSDVTNLRENKGSAYTLVNVRAGYRWRQWSIAGFADNLFEKRVALTLGLSGVSTTTGEVELLDAPSFNVNDHRVYGVELRFAY